MRPAAFPAHLRFQLQREVFKRLLRHDEISVPGSMNSWCTGHGLSGCINKSNLRPRRHLSSSFSFLTLEMSRAVYRLRVAERLSLHFIHPAISISPALCVEFTLHSRHSPYESTMAGLVPKGRMAERPFCSGKTAHAPRRAPVTFITTSAIAGNLTGLKI